MPCGMWFTTTAADHIFYEKQTSDFHRNQIILHELGHMLCGHTMDFLSTDSGLIADSGTVDRDIVRAALKRTSYTTEKERHAEIVASLILKRSNRTLAKPSGTHDRWLGSALGLIDD
jgi:Zn-dependent peptidase ImmA (M78 family)